MLTEKGRPFYPQASPGQQDDSRDSERGGERVREGTGEVQDAVTATGILARLRAILGVETPPARAVATRDKSTAAPPRRTKREAVLEADVTTLRKENNDLRRQLAESQGRERALKQELDKARTKARRETSSAKPYATVSDLDHEKIMAFLKKYELDPNEDYDRALALLLSRGEVKVRR